MCFYGFKLLRPCLFLGGVLTCCMCALLFCYLIYSSSTDDFMNTFYYFLGGGFLCGLLLGYVLAKYVQWGAAVLAGWGGFALGVILNEAFLFHLESKWVFWVSTIGCIIVCSMMTLKLFDPTMICATALLGSYLMVRGVSCYAGHYYNEFTMVKLM